MALSTKVYEEASKENQANEETTTKSADDKKDDVQEASYEEK